MRNPAWRPAQLHTERLASIQHHFIDERPAVRSSGKPGVTHTLPVHMAVAAGHTANVLQPHYLVDALTRQLNIQTSAVAEHPDWQLEAIPLGRRATIADQGFILVFATANLEGVRLAYTGIKKLSATPSRQFGVLFSGARDGEFARRCQERLTSGAKRFLGIRLHELGHLSAPGPDFSADLARLAGEVHRLWGTHSIHNQLEITHT
ncbi:MAG: hypothetical protein QNL87_02205 [Gammaproteobacteria bacterium]|nr:hypothetical protein [Gammaproteobacteria bacterium]